MFRSRTPTNAANTSPPHIHPTSSPPPPPQQQQTITYRNPSPRPAYQPNRRPPGLNRSRMTAAGTIPPAPAMLSSLANVTNIEESDSDSDTASQPSISPPSQSIPRINGDITRPVHFYTPPRYGSPPRFIVAHSNGTGIKNFGTVPIKVTIRDIRNKEHRFHLGLHSFKPLRHLSPLPYPLNLQNPEMATLVTTSATEIITRYVPSPTKISIISTNLLKANNPIGLPSPQIAHPLQISQTPSSALLLANRHLPPAIASQISAGKLSMRILNIYRPILAPSQKLSDHPFYVSESHSILDEDLVPVEHVYSDHVGATYAVRHDESQRFWYWSEMDNTEGFIVQIYDSLYGCDVYGEERSIRAATGFFKLMPKESEEGRDAEWLVVKALVVG
ncbi:hypothetical protein TWF506_004744 [Arthrobotrys conoides]|uniref:Uncharacterized protein n=1 Tax=Arthrobotrys conoides TaxID=74498 RepID=A0AAN8RI41_9PEZI